MSDENIESEVEDPDNTSPTVTYTQVASCAFGPDGIDRRRQGLRARLEREKYERELKRQKSFINVFRNLFGVGNP
ncbi:MAG: hypothetical protein GY785_25285 [Gammaproteobacteria bacterium]|nr:hypothetical protein [Gammaproteobacteria bacterium]